MNQLLKVVKERELETHQDLYLLKENTQDLTKREKDNTGQSNLRTQVLYQESKSRAIIWEAPMATIDLEKL